MRSARPSRDLGLEAPSITRWKNLLSKLLARISGVSWDAIASGVAALGFVPISEEIAENMIATQALTRRSNIDKDSHI
eukprot:2579071-Prymnesium_polylepis.2